jgi:hypothetical protein
LCLQNKYTEAALFFYIPQLVEGKSDFRYNSPCLKLVLFSLRKKQKWSEGLILNFLIYSSDKYLLNHKLELDTVLDISLNKMTENNCIMQFTFYGERHEIKS